MGYMYPTTTLVAGYDGGRVHINVDQVWEADDPFVKSHPDLFSDVPQKVHRTTTAPVIETATAAPGEVRNTRRGSK